MSNPLPLDELSTVIARVNGLLLTEQKVDQALKFLAKAAKEAVPGTLGAGVSLLDAQGRRTSSASTDRIVEQADAVQYELSQGPCLTAWAAEETILVDDVQADARWPEWSAAVSHLPIRSVVSTPLKAGNGALGALKIYAGVPSVYTEETGSLLELFAGPASTLLANIQGTETPHRISESLEAALHSRDTIARATGVLMERHGWNEEDSMRELLRQARAEKTTLLEACNRTIADVVGPRQ